MKGQIHTIIKKLRNQVKLPQRVMAEKLGLQVPAYSNLEAGKTDITFEKLCTIAEVLNLKPFELVEMIETAEERSKFKIDALRAEIAGAIEENDHLLKVIRDYKAI